MSAEYTDPKEDCGCGRAGLAAQAAAAVLDPLWKIWERGSGCALCGRLEQEVVPRVRAVASGGDLRLSAVRSHPPRRAEGVCVLVEQVATTASHWSKLVRCRAAGRHWMATCEFARRARSSVTRRALTRRSWQSSCATSPSLEGTSAEGLTLFLRRRAQARTNGGCGRCAGASTTPPIGGG